MGSKAGALLVAARRAGLTPDEYRANLDAGLKACWHCRFWRPVQAFGRDRTRGDGRAAVCHGCRATPRQLRLIQPTAAELERLRYASDSDYRFERRQHSTARKRGVLPMPVDGRDALLELFRGRCAYCPSPARTWDHLVPVSQGGKTKPGNMVPACISCNSRKRTRNVFEFINTNGIVPTNELLEALALAREWGPLGDPPDLRLRQFPA